MAFTTAPRPVVLFDLDGTLLPLDMKTFTEAYFKTLCGRFSQYNPQDVSQAVWAGTGAMVKNDGSRTNREAFAAVFSQALGVDYYEQEAEFLDYYAREFQRCADVCRPSELSRKIVTTLQHKGYTVAVATNPIFPSIATESRMRWAGVSPEDFEYYTTYENSVHCKPNPDYYRDILAHCGLRAEECLMVGNDVSEDMVTETLGMKVFLLTDCLINKEGKDLSGYPQGNFEDLMTFIQKLR